MMCFNFKTMKYFFFTVILAFVVTYSFSQSEKEKGYVDVSGLWVDSNSASFQNCYLIISQTGRNVVVAHYLEFDGTSMVEEGKGTVSGRKVVYKVKVTKAIPGWATSGTHYLELSEDGNTLRGAYKDAKGNTGPIVFKKKG